eukprot:1637852-Rhodomonas_salina.1
MRERERFGGTSSGSAPQLPPIKSAAQPSGHTPDWGFPSQPSGSTESVSVVRASTLTDTTSRHAHNIKQELGPRFTTTFSAFGVTTQNWRTSMLSLTRRPSRDRTTTIDARTSSFRHGRRPGEPSWAMFH